MRKEILLSVCLLLSLITNAQIKKEDKRKKLRELSPDRPHQTESPHTVDVGHFMFETDILNNTFYSKDIPHRSTTGIFYFNLKTGLQKNMDIEILSNAYATTHYEHNTHPSVNSSFPDLTFRYKLNVLGNDSGKTSLAIMPFVTTTNLFHEEWHPETGGIFLNAEHMISDKYELGYTGGLISFAINPFFKQHEWFSTVSFSYPLYRSLNHFVEISDRLNDSAVVRNNYSFDSGFTLTPTENNQFDMGFYYFIPAKMLYVFIGTTVRL